MSNKVLNTYNQDENGTLIQSLRNVSSFNTVALNVSNRWKITPYINYSLEANRNYDWLVDDDGEHNLQMYWNAKSVFNFKIFKKVDLEIKYAYNSEKEMNQVSWSGFHDLNLNISGMFFKEKVLLSLDIVNVLAYPKGEMTIVGDNFVKKIESLPESPIVYLSASMNIFKFYETE